MFYNNLVDVIKPKPPQALPRTILNTTNACNNNSNNNNNTEISTNDSHTSSIKISSAVDRPDSLPKPLSIINSHNIQHEPSNGGGKIVRRIAGKQITTLFEVCTIFCLFNLFYLNFINCYCWFKYTLCRLSDGSVRNLFVLLSTILVHGIFVSHHFLCST